VRQSLLLGVWWRFNSYLTRSTQRAIGVLVGMYLLQRTLSLWAVIHQREMLQQLIAYGWLGICAYSWFAPVIYRRMLEKELAQVSLRPDF
jgi:hypothetical protein